MTTITNAEPSAPTRRIEPHPRRGVTGRRAAESIRDEIEALPGSQVLIDRDSCRVCIARASQIPRALREIGRLREVAFRAAGEGTGQALDLDRFDVAYLHLIVWERREHEIVGAYRLVETDQVIREYGIEGLYTSTLFAYDPQLFETLGPSLELGRAFVQPRYQRRAYALPMLWRGIARFAARHPRYRVLLGAASISASYRPESRALMAAWLQHHHGAPDLARLLQARSPWSIGGDAHDRILSVTDERALSEVISGLEPDGKGVPVLLREYLKLGARILGFNVDAAFSCALDVLLAVDLTRVDARVLALFMGRAEATEFMDAQADLEGADARRPGGPSGRSASAA